MHDAIVSPLTRGELMNTLKTIPFNVRLPYQVWLYLKNYCTAHKLTDPDLSMNTMIIDLIREHKKNNKNSIDSE